VNDCIDDCLAEGDKRNCPPINPVRARNNYFSGQMLLREPDRLISGLRQVASDLT